MYPNGVCLPIDIDEIIEAKCGIEMDFAEMDEKVLGFSDIQQNTIRINANLLGGWNNYRMRFTMAHELGHFSLHRHLMTEHTPMQHTLNVYTNNYSRIEKQANMFASHLLMPAPLVCEQWIKVTGSEKPYSVEEENKKNEEIRQKMEEMRKREGLSSLLGGYIVSCNDSWQFTTEISQAFQVSYQCARIQLENLGFFTDPSINHGMKLSGTELRQSCSFPTLS
jgi:hypothetical protein